MRISDWSSDVCSSDLLGPSRRKHRAAAEPTPRSVSFHRRMRCHRWQRRSPRPHHAPVGELKGRLMLTITSLGAAGTVTGSKHLLEHTGKRLLTNFGLFQGMTNLRELNWEPIPFPPTRIAAVLPT